jgi:UDP-2,3-diacylglucosamine pyrophosphatase LpxH
LTNDLKWAISSDQQIPYHDKRAIELWFKVLKAFKPDVVDILGDTSDQACYSKYTEGRPAEFLLSHRIGEGETILPLMKAEEQGAKEFYQQCRKTAKRGAELFTALGNHDIRVFDYVEKKLPEYAEHVTPEALWGLDSQGWDYIYYGDLPKHRYGDIYVHHGVAISQNAGESVRKDMESFGVSIIRGHSHRAGYVHKTYELRNETLRGWEIGHMADVKSPGMGYTNVHNWQQGFAIAHIESGVSHTKDGYYPHIQFIEISPDYTCIVDGRKFYA